MATFLVLTNYSNGSLSVKAGDILDEDNYSNFDGLLADGLMAIDTLKVPQPILDNEIEQFRHKLATGFPVREIDLLALLLQALIDRTDQTQAIAGTTEDLDAGVTFVTIDATSGNSGLNIPAAADVPNYKLTVKRLDNSLNTITITPESGTIEDDLGVLGANRGMTVDGGLTFRAVGTSWRVTSAFTV